MTFDQMKSCLVSTVLDFLAQAAGVGGDTQDMLLHLRDKARDTELLVRYLTEENKKLIAHNVELAHKLAVAKTLNSGGNDGEVH